MRQAGGAQRSPPQAALALAATMKKTFNAKTQKGEDAEDLKSLAAPFLGVTIW